LAAAGAAVARRDLLKRQSATVLRVEEGLSYIWGFLWVWRLAVSACGTRLRAFLHSAQLCGDVAVAAWRRW
jgi:hypothetical protein